MTWRERDAYHVYILTDADGAAVYVGQTGALADRLWQHARCSPWWRHVADFALAGPYATRAEAREAEQALIWHLGPLANRPTVGDFSHHFGLDYVDWVDTNTTRRVRESRAA